MTTTLSFLIISWSVIVYEHSGCSPLPSSTSHEVPPPGFLYFTFWIKDYFCIPHKQTHTIHPYHLDLEGVFCCFAQLPCLGSGPAIGLPLNRSRDVHLRVGPTVREFYNVLKGSHLVLTNNTVADSASLMLLRLCCCWQVYAFNKSSPNRKFHHHLQDLC